MLPNQLISSVKAARWPPPGSASSGPARRDRAHLPSGPLVVKSISRLGPFTTATPLPLLSRWRSLRSGSACHRSTRCRDVIQYAADVVLHRFDGIDGEPVLGERRELDAHPLDMVPPDFMPARNTTGATFYSRAVNDLVGTDALDQKQACRELSGGPSPQDGLGVTNQVINDGTLAEHQLSGHQRSEQPVARGQILRAVKLA